MKEAFEYLDELELTLRNSTDIAERKHLRARIVDLQDRLLGPSCGTPLATGAG